jgi:hypothetical protein
MMRYGLISLTFCFLFSSVGFADQMIITTLDGRVIQGEVTETEDGYEVTTQFGVTSLHRSEVDSIEVLADPDEEYAERLAALDADDAAGRIELGEWAEENGRLVEAQTLFEEALDLLPADSPERRYVELKIAEVANAIAAAEQAEVPPTEPAGNEPSNDGGAAGRRDPDSLGLVSMDDVFTIRWKELHDNEGTWAANSRLNVRFTNNVEDVFADNMAGRQVYVPGDDGSWTERELFDARAFGRLSRSEKLFFIMANISRDDVTYSSDIRIQGDPQFMEHFRRDIWPLIDDSCAQAACHGGTEAPGGLRFIRPIRGSTSEVGTRTYYTNFMILNTYGQDGLELIDRIDVGDSLLLQFGLPAGQARFVHPPVSGASIRSLYDNAADDDYQMVFTWIQDELHYPEPFYGVQVAMPDGEATSPAEEPQGDEPEGDTEEPTSEPDE